MTDDTMERISEALRGAAEANRMPACFILGVKQRAFLRSAVQMHSSEPIMQGTPTRIGNLPVWFSDEPDQVELELLAGLGEFLKAERCLKVKLKGP